MQQEEKREVIVGQIRNWDKVKTYLILFMDHVLAASWMCQNGFGKMNRPKVYKSQMVLNSKAVLDWLCFRKQHVAVYGRL